MIAPLSGILGLDLDKITASPGPSANTSDIIEPEREDQTPEQPVLIRSSGGRSRYRSDQPFAEDGAESWYFVIWAFFRSLPFMVSSMEMFQFCHRGRCSFNKQHR